MNKKQLHELEEIEEIDMTGVIIIHCANCGMSKYTTTMGDCSELISNCEFDKSSKCCPHPDYWSYKHSTMVKKEEKMPDYTLFDKEVDISKLNIIALISMFFSNEQKIIKLQKKRDCIIKELKIRNI